MATVKDITTMCKAGQVQEAYELAMADMGQQLPWAQREMGWALYYLIKEDEEGGNYQSLITHLDEFFALDQLTLPYDNMIYENVLFKIAGYVKAHVQPKDMNSPAKLSTFFSKLRNHTFEPSRGYSFLLSSFIKCDTWQEMGEFLEWWNLDKLTQDDYTPYKLENGRTLMSVAERAYIAMSKALLRMNDAIRINEFLPKLNNLMENHPEMIYPGYFYGKLLISLGSTKEEELRVIVPFARKKINDFWVWQLLSDVFADDSEKQLACLLRATHCRTEEDFLVKVRTKLAKIYETQNDYNRARYQIDAASTTYLKKGWPLPNDLTDFIHKDWIGPATPDKSDPIDYLSITDGIICEGAEEAIAVVSYYDEQYKKFTLIYGKEKRIVQKLRIKAGIGVALKINYLMEADGSQRILTVSKTNLPNNLDYAKVVEGKVKQHEEWAYAFLKYEKEKIFISPATVSKYNLKDGEIIKALVVYDYNRKKEKWNWVCISVKR